MKYVLDASVSIRWVVTSPLTPQAIRLRNEFGLGVHHLLSPDIYIDEIASALTKAERQKMIQVGHAAALFVQVMNTPPILHSRLPLIQRAIEISSQTRSGFFDCLYVALAEQEACGLVTADERLVRNLQARFPFIRSLASMP